MGMTFSSGSCGGYTKPVKYAEAVVNCKEPGVCVCLLGGVCFGLLNYKLFRIADLVNKILPLYILKKKIGRINAQEIMKENAKEDKRIQVLSVPDSVSGFSSVSSPPPPRLPLPLLLPPPKGSCPPPPPQASF